MELSFIVIDDSELDCFIARKIIGHTDKNLPITTFQNARQALQAISEGTANAGALVTIILLDLQMPLMNGFEFVEEFEKLPAEMQKKYKIVLLSSTRNTNDIFRILTYNTVNSLLEKPLTQDKLLTLLLQVKTE